MTTQKDFKRLVRARMLKTGESYTSARLQLLKGGDRVSGGGGREETITARPDSASPTPDPRPPAPAFAELAGISDAALKKATGCAWDKWVFVLDKVEAHTWPHREIAEYVQEKYKVPDWWTQMVTVGYERIKGLREKGQRRDGGFEASRSKTVPVPVSKLFRAWSDKRNRARWLDAEITVRTSRKDRSMRITWADGTAVDLWFEARGKARSTVAVTHRKLTGRADAAERKAWWGERLDKLARLLTPAKTRAA